MAQTALAQPAVETVQAWFDKDWEQAQTMPDFGDTSIEWTVEVVYVPPPAEMAALQSAVAAQQGHPDAGLLASYQRRLRGQFDRFDRRMWVRSIDSWRVNSVNSFGGYSDRTVTPRYAWRATPRQLVLADQSGSKGDYDRIANHWRVMWPEMKQILDGGFSSGAISGLEPGPVEIIDGKWRVVASSILGKGEPTQFKLEFVGRWGEELGRGFVEQSTIINAGNPDSIGITYHYEDWQWVEALNHWVAGRAEQFNPDSSPERNLIRDRIWTFNGATHDPELTYEELIKVPDHERGDVIRGLVEYARVEDHRSGITRDRRNDGTIHETQTINQAPRQGMGLPQSAQKTSGRGLPFGLNGWPGLVVVAGIAMLLPIALVLVYLKRRSRQAAG